MLIIPAIDLRGGRCVRLAQGDFGRETDYGGSPGAIAKQFKDAGATWIHVVDLDGARTGLPENWPLLGEIIEQGLRVELGGGIRTIERAREAVALGVERVVVGSKLVQDAELSAAFFGELGEQVVAGIDARDGMVATEGWIEGSNLTAADLARRVAAQGCQRVIVTDISRDGMQTGPNLDFLDEILRAATVKVIQSGGIGSYEHISQLRAVDHPGLEGVIVGRAIYEGSIDLGQALQLVSAGA